jgi:hypothetical protein
MYIQHWGIFIHMRTKKNDVGEKPDYLGWTKIYVQYNGMTEQVHTMYQHTYVGYNIGKMGTENTFIDTL